MSAYPGTARLLWIKTEDKKIACNEEFSISR
jgi:hypothetical protein